MKPKDNYKNSAFIQGYACAVSTIIRMEHEVNALTKELFHSGLGKYDLRKFRRWGIDEYDIDIFKAFRKELQ